MNGELSHGLPALITSGNRILRVNEKSPVLLRGVNRSGLEYSEPDAGGFLSAAGISRDEIQEIVAGWRANVIRLPFNQDWCLDGRRGHSAEEYLSSLDQVISWAAEMGAYSILDLQWLDAEKAYGTTEHPGQGRITNRVPPTPNEQTITLWRTLAARYRGETAVLFDLLNEPHDALNDDLYPLNLIGADGSLFTSNERRFPAEEWSRWASLLTAVIREIKPEGIILVGGVDWAFDLRNVWVDAPNIVYSSHVYANRNERDWPKALGRCREVPVFVGEWGGAEQNLAFGANLARELRRLGLGWTAWSWSDFPPLVQLPRAQAFEPTAFGVLVRNELTSFSA
jgi:endoglucanase